MQRSTTKVLAVARCFWKLSGRALKSGLAGLGLLHAGFRVGMVLGKRNLLHWPKEVLTFQLLGCHIYPPRKPRNGAQKSQAAIPQSSPEWIECCPELEATGFPGNSLNLEPTAAVNKDPPYNPLIRSLDHGPCLNLKDDLPQLPSTGKFAEGPPSGEEGPPKAAKRCNQQATGLAELRTHTKS